MMSLATAQSWLRSGERPHCRCLRIVLRDAEPVGDCATPSPAISFFHIAQNLLIERTTLSFLGVCDAFPHEQERRVVI